jgi:cytidine deaminase
MKKSPITPEDQKLVKAAVTAVQKKVLQPLGEKGTAQVGAAVRLSGGKIITSVNLIADVGGLSVCAESVALAEAMRYPDKKVESIVAVYHMPGKEPKVVSPCGRCREFITDYAGGSVVILREPKSSGLFKVKAVDLLPLKYASYWQGGKLV